MYFCTYKYNNELDLVFKSCNAVSGFFDRADQCRKYAFGCMMVHGVDGDLALTGCWMFRGTEIIPEMKACDDYELYDWTRVDINNPEHRKLVENYWYVCDGCHDNRAWDGDFPIGKKVNQGKAFK